MSGLLKPKPLPGVVPPTRPYAPPSKVPFAPAPKAYAPPPAPAPAAPKLMTDPASYGRAKGFLASATATPPRPAAPGLRPASPPSPAAPDPNPAAVGMPKVDRQWIGAMQSPDRPAFPAGRDAVAQSRVGRAMIGPDWKWNAAPPPTKSYMDYIHGEAMRGGAMASSIAQGYPMPQGGGMHPSSTQAVDRMNRGYPFQMPPTRITHDVPQATTSFDPRARNITVADTPPPPGQAIGQNYLQGYRHEVDHALAEPPAGFDRTQGFDEIGFNLGAEIAPSLSDVVDVANEHQQVVGAPLDHQVQFPNGKTNNAGWMARQGQQHGLFDGKTMTQLLATPSGLAYVRSMTRPPDYVDALNMGGGR